MLWLLFVASLLVFRGYANMIGFAALATGLVRRIGMPQFSKEYLQRAMFDDNFHMISYLCVVSMIGALNFVMYIPVLIYAWLVSG